MGFASPTSQDAAASRLGDARCAELMHRVQVNGTRAEPHGRGWVGSKLRVWAQVIWIEDLRSAKKLIWLPSEGKGITQGNYRWFFFCLVVVSGHILGLSLIPERSLLWVDPGILHVFGTEQGGHELVPQNDPLQIHGDFFKVNTPIVMSFPKMCSKVFVDLLHENPTKMREDFQKFSVWWTYRLLHHTDQPKHMSCTMFIFQWQVLTTKIPKIFMISTWPRLKFNSWLVNLPPPNVPQPEIRPY